MIRTKRAYEQADPGDGVRILVDRMWPRGVSKEEAKIDVWLKEIAPSKELRKWFGHDPARWDEFSRHYAEELAPVLPTLEKLLGFIERQNERVTLVFAAKDEEHNNAVALTEMLAK